MQEKWQFAIDLTFVKENQNKKNKDRKTGSFSPGGWGNAVQVQQWKLIHVNITTSSAPAPPCELENIAKCKTPESAGSR